MSLDGNSIGASNPLHYVAIFALTHLRLTELVTSMHDINNKPSAYSFEELIACSEGQLFGPGNAQLPAPNMLMMDRITHISEDGGKYGKGNLIAELDIKPDLWFFDCHFPGDPVMPGCLGLDAMWQLIGFYLGWLGNPGRGRALGAGDVKFFGEVTPDIKTVRYEINIKRIITRKLIMAIGEGAVFADDKQIYEASGLKVGLFGGDSGLN